MAIPSPRRACRTSPPTWTSPPWPTPRSGGLQVLGYTSQARFLMNAGLMELLAQLDPSDAAAYARAVAPVQKLLSEAEMGELFRCWRWAVASPRRCVASRAATGSASSEPGSATLAKPRATLRGGLMRIPIVKDASPP